MQFSDSYSPIQHEVYVPMFPIGFRARSNLTTHHVYIDMLAWLIQLDYCDYIWDRVLFTVTDLYGVSNKYPTGISFVHASDALAFKLKFGL